MRLLVLLVFGMAGPLRATAAAEWPPLRFGFSSQVIGDVNENDARASLKVWARTMGGERDIPVDPMIEIYRNIEATRDALLSKKIDAVTVTTGEFWTLRRTVPLGPIILGRSHGEITEEYLLLVHRDNPAARLADLRGQSVGFLSGSRSSLAPVWVETLLLEENLGPAGTFWGKTMCSGKLSRIVLPVFFRQMDACVVTRAGFRTMTELNPQVGRQLKILAQSPPLVPDLFCFRGDLVSPHRDALLATAGRIADTPAGRQTLVLFQAERIEARPLSDLDTACALLDRHAQLSAAAQEAGVPRESGTAIATAEDKAP